MEYGLGTTGTAGTWGQPDTIQRHAVPLPWQPGMHTGTARCGKRVSLVWAWGLALAFSLTDGSLCVECVRLTLNRPASR